MNPQPETQVFEFDAELEPGNGGGVFVRFPYDVPTVFGTKGRVAVTATFDGEPYRGSLVSMGVGCHVIGVLKAIRTKIGKQPGDVVHVRLQQDLLERTVEMPEELQVLLNEQPALKAHFEQLAYTHRREYAHYISEAKRSETRLKRAEKTVEMLQKGKRGI